MSKMLFKNTLRDIGRTKARFISIMLIVLLGVGFLVGVSSTAPSMYAVVNKFYKDTNLMHFRMISTVGFSDEDIKAVENMEGVEEVMPSYFYDVLTKGDTGSVIRLYAMPEAYEDNKEINSLTLKEGRMPQKANEIIIGASRFGDYTIGDSISFFSPENDGDLSDMLANTEYEIVGIADSPMYISFERGATNVGSGKIAAYMMVPAENFIIERYTDLYVTFSELREYTPYSDEYEALSSSILKKLEALGETRVHDFISENVDAAQASIDEAQATLESEKAKAEDEINSAQDKINEGRNTLEKEIASAEQTLADAKNQIEAGEVELQVAKQEFATKTQQAQQTLDKAQADILQGEKAIADAKVQMKESLFASVESFGITREQFEQLYGDKDMLSVEDVENLSVYAQFFNMSLESQLKDAKEKLSALWVQLQSQGIDPEMNVDYISAKALVDELTNKIAALYEFATDGKAQLILAIEEINAQQAELTKAREQWLEGKQTFEAETKQAQKKLDGAEKQLDFARTEYAAGVTALEEKQREALAEFSDAQTQLDLKKEEAQAEFEKAEIKLSDAQAELDAIPEAQWICSSRDGNPGYAAYKDDVDRVTAVGRVFPIFFLLVAVLVCVTTMTRLIEEQRSDLGAFTTLGYRKGAIIGKYVGYCIGATLAGAIVGVALGVFTIPYVIFNAYRMLYSSLPDLILTINAPGAIIATLVAIICTSGVAFITCNSLLRKPPATLLRPKTPKAGKRILLERVNFIWSRLSFFSKVTVRNIFRYKARFFMTILGVAGCTALVLSAFGLYVSINDVVDKQFGKVFSYDAIVAVESCDSGYTIKEQFDADGRIDSSVLCRQTLVNVLSKNASFYDDTYICVPENIEEFEQQVNLQQRKNGEKITLDGNSVVLSEKLAKNLKVTVGDRIAVIDKDTKTPFIVSGICENYLYGYVYMSPEVYKENFGFEPEYNLIMFSQNQDAKGEEISTDYLEKEGVLGISLINDSVTNFADMIESLNYVVLVMLVCAGALAFVVLYNLTNINIAERKREISTLKVLGFKSSETSAYIYRENLLLSVLGTGAGLLLGVWLLRFIIATVEIDMLMFGREIPFWVFAVSALITLLFATIVNVIMHFRIKKIDMVESMKSVE